MTRITQLSQDGSKYYSIRALTIGMAINSIHYRQ